MTIHGPGYLIGCDPQRRLVCVTFTKDDCIDVEMLTKYHGDNWTLMIGDDEVLHDTAA
jgi:hypothetical protein